MPIHRVGPVSAKASCQTAARSDPRSSPKNGWICFQISKMAIPFMNPATTGCGTYLTTLPNFTLPNRSWQNAAEQELAESADQHTGGRQTDDDHFSVGQVRRQAGIGGEGSHHKRRDEGERRLGSGNLSRSATKERREKPTENGGIQTDKGRLRAEFGAQCVEGGHPIGHGHRQSDDGGRQRAGKFALNPE